MVQLSDARTFVVADIPGIIEGAHEGKGLGLQFLRHVERTRVLAFLIPIDAMEWQQEYDDLHREVAAYSAELAEKPHCVVFTKLDLLGEEFIPSHGRAGLVRRVRDQRGGAHRARRATRRLVAPAPRDAQGGGAA